MDESVKMTAVEMVDDLKIRVTFSDGTTRIVDLSSLLKGRPKWIDRGVFAGFQLHHDSDTILWSDGDHLHGEELYEWDVGLSKRSS